MLRQERSELQQMVVRLSKIVRQQLCLKVFQAQDQAGVTQYRTSPQQSVSNKKRGFPVTGFDRNFQGIVSYPNSKGSPDLSRPRGLQSFRNLSLPGVRSADETLFTKAFGLHPEKGLMDHGLLWFSILIPVLYFVAIGYVSWEPYTLSMSSDGFAKFISISTLPLTILSLAIPLPVLVSRFHATQQTATQLKATKLKNNIDVFHAHRKAMFEYFDRVPKATFEGTLDCEFKVHPRLHINAFRGSKPEQGSPRVFEDFSKVSNRTSSPPARWHITR